jgi:hypothetical protein
MKLLTVDDLAAMYSYAEISAAADGSQRRGFRSLEMMQVAALGQIAIALTRIADRLDAPVTIDVPKRVAVEVLP